MNKELKECIMFLQVANLSNDQRYCVDVLIKELKDYRMKCDTNMKTALSLTRQLIASKGDNR